MWHTTISMYDMLAVLLHTNCKPHLCVLTKIFLYICLNVFHLFMDHIAIQQIIYIILHVKIFYIKPCTVLVFSRLMTSTLVKFLNYWHKKERKQPVMIHISSQLENLKALSLPFGAKVRRAETFFLAQEWRPCDIPYEDTKLTI